MDPPAAWFQTCICGRSFSVPQAYTYHKRTCQKTRKRLASALDKAKEVWQAKKRPKVVVEEPPGASNLPAVPETTFVVGPNLMGTISSVSDIDQSLAERRGRREHRQLPRRYRDVLPEPPAALPPPSQPPPAEPMVPSSPILTPVRTVLKSTRNIFGLFRQYHATHFPAHDPDENLSSKDLIDIFPHTLSSIPMNLYHPYPTRSSFLLGEWYWNDGAKKSQSSFKNLLEIVGHPGFRQEDVMAVNWKRIDAQLGGETQDHCDEDGWEDEPADGEWVKTPIKIDVPFHRRTLHPGREQFEAGILYHRKLVSVIREKISRLSSYAHLHLEPYELFWQPSESLEPVRVHGELYASEAFVSAHRDLQASPGEPGCNLPKVILALMFASDGTQLTAFSNAKLWPLYLAVGNESKYRRTKPSCNAFEHIAYFETLPDHFKAFAAERFGGKGPSNPFMAHCQREMYQAQWDIILDDEFLEAYAHGIVIDCCDGIRYRFYPRIFTYSADYREKILIVGIRNLGRCLCPRCLIPKDRADNMGRHQDMKQRFTLARVDNMDRRHRIATARNLIYEKNYAVDSAPVKRLLQKDCLVPSANAFSDKLATFGLCMFRMMVVDLMHEVELNVWKAVFIHLLRILDCVNEALKYELDRRFREIPPFGLDGIRKIWSNRSELKKMTAHDYEDMLQCAIPVFDGLLPEPHNTRVLKLLFNLAHWHGLAKLRMHTDTTLDLLSRVTKSLGKSLRDFQEKTCTAFQTRELERERAARQRRQEKSTARRGPGPTQVTLLTAAGGAGTAESTNAENFHRAMQDPQAGAASDAMQPSLNAANNISSPTLKASKNNARKLRLLNLNTYTYHSLGDYVTTIRHFGTTDSYSTQPSEREHRTSKARFPRTSGRLIPLQMSRIERRQRLIRAIRERLGRLLNQTDVEDVANDPEVQYNIGKTQNTPVHVPTFLQKNDGDPAVKNFFTKLRDHILPRIQDLLQREATCRPGHMAFGTVPYNVGDSPTHDSDACKFVFFKNDRMYQHQLGRFHFTTYDVQRGTDIVNPGTARHNIMLLAENPDAEHYFLYARVLGIYHANVVYTGPGMLDYEARRVDFLWVRWYEVIDPTTPGWSKSKLDSVRFPSMNSKDAFGFVDPKDVLRGCHIMPNFAKGKRHADGVGISCCAKDADDYCQYYVGRFSERDLIMRYHWGLAVGHLHAHQPTGIPDHNQEEPDILDDHSPEHEDEAGMDESNANAEAQDGNSDVCDSDDPELGFEDREHEGWDDVESEGGGEDDLEGVNIEEDA